jgi:hypothetical protein
VAASRGSRIGSSNRWRWHPHVVAGNWDGAGVGGTVSIPDFDDLGPRDQAVGAHLIADTSAGCGFLGAPESLRDLCKIAESLLNWKLYSEKLCCEITRFPLGAAASGCFSESG